jgi:hypothetical protein
MRRLCPDNAALIIQGEHFPCDAMNGMGAESTTHQGWPHSNRDAEAIWSPMPLAVCSSAAADSQHVTEETR